MLNRILEMIVPAAWGAMWIIGGYLMVRRAFNLRPSEQILAGITCGLVVENWLANLIGHAVPLPLAFWLAAAIVLAAGTAFWWPFKDWRQLLPIRFRFWQILAFLALFYLAYATGRGLALADDYQNLPMTSILATGDIPPHFALDPSVSFGYHYFMLLFAAQLMRVVNLDVWTALDVIRGLALALSVMLMGLWVQRLTASRLAGLVGGLVYAFGMGTRWLLLLLPASVVDTVSKHVNMIGTGLASGPELSTALVSSWVIEGDGPLHWPFAFANGIFQSPFMTLNGTANMWPMIGFLLLLTANRWRGWRAWALTTVFLASLGMLGEAGVVMGIAAGALIAAWYTIRHRSFRLPKNLLAWLGAIAAATVLILLQGGVFTDLFLSRLGGLSGASSEGTYFSFAFPFVFPPQVMSAHLGALSLFDPPQLLAALAEIGPVILALPLVIAFCIKAVRSSSWYLAWVTLTGILGLGTFFFQYSGSAGASATIRIQWLVFGVCQVFAVPLVWIWARKRSQTVKALAVVLAFVMVLGGVVEFGFQLVAIQAPTTTTFIGPLDVKAMRDYWNRLEPGALVFDANVYRAPTLFGRKTDSSQTWYALKPAWQALAASPDPAALHAYGFSYAYLDRAYVYGLPSVFQQKLSGSCVKLVKEYTSPDGDFRRLVDIRGCQ